MIETGDNMDGDFEDLKEQNGVDNSELEEIMKREITPESQRDFLEILKDSQLFMPVIYSDNIFEGIENAEPGDVLEPQDEAPDVQSEVPETQAEAAEVPEKQQSVAEMLNEAL